MSQDQQEIDEMQKEFEEAEQEQASYNESVKTFTGSVNKDALSKEDLAVMDAYMDKESIGVHVWAINTPVVVKVLSGCYETSSNKREQFNAEISMKVNGKWVSKNAKVNVFSGMRTQFRKLMKCFIKNTKNVNYEDKTYKKKINGHSFGMNYIGTSDSLKYKDPNTGLPYKTKSIVTGSLSKPCKTSYKRR